MNEPIEVLITMPFPDSLVSRLGEISPRLKFTILKASRPEDITPEVWSKVEILYTNRVIPAVELVPNLHWVQFHWAGVDHIVNNPLLGKTGLVATTLSGAAASQMAEYILMMLLTLGHHLHDMLAFQKRSEWARDRWERFSPLELRGSTVGMLGYGSIARHTARLLHTFGANVLATKRDAMHPEDYDYIPAGMGDPGGDFVHRLYPPEALRSMLKECDFVVITLPKTPSTQNLIKAEELAACKPGAFIIDVSRGGILDHTALLNALKDKKLAGAALDVYPEEPLPADSPLWKLPNVILTPHISGNTPYYDERAVDLFVTNLQRYVAGLPLYNRIETQRGY
jgi:phosphoglycerate dehydrogenase-like enzyme